MSSTQVDVIDRMNTITALQNKVDDMIADGETSIDLTDLKTWIRAEILILPNADPQVKRLFFVTKR